MADETQGLPDVDLGPVLDDIKANQEGKQPEPQKSSTGEFDLGQFKNPKDLLKSYKEIQAAFTRVTQENKSFKEQQAKLSEEVDLMRYQAPIYQQPQQPAQQFDMNEDIDVRIQKTVAVQRIAEVLEEEAEKNRGEFQERYAYAQMIAREYPQLSSSSRGVKKLFELGDKRRNEDLRKNAGKALESMFGEPIGEEEIARLKTLIKGTKSQTQQSQSNLNAYMPDTSTSTQTGQTQNRNQNTEAAIDEAVKKGDVDGTISALFKGLMAE